MKNNHRSNCSTIQKWKQGPDNKGRCVIRALARINGVSPYVYNNPTRGGWVEKRYGDTKKYTAWMLSMNRLFSRAEGNFSMEKIAQTIQRSVSHDVKISATMSVAKTMDDAPDDSGGGGDGSDSDPDGDPARPKSFVIPFHHQLPRISKLNRLLFSWLSSKSCCVVDWGRAA